LRVSARGLVVEATGNVPEAPVVTSLTAGAVLATGGSITVSWTSATDPDRFAVYVNKEGGYVRHRELPGTTRKIEIAAGELPKGVALRISVVAYNDGSFSGPAHPDSRMGIMSVGHPGLVITINP
ncbi:MAG: hypothetical protein LJF04_01225, partial [Gemmatimonadetes bacterium]|nr:hypothetical protein [Gemmatimonadota bacterium]